ncbi:hypothetical protein PGT21_011523 [Puccinia graminis f. sp. tritici]|uniref:Uncharacterized protein n=1 Tax=Puccinia graminis f. sp. tritici TaxID=56615 RepID=A0A5B0MU68_PUCGR|nr:hypothetical protein PGT21_011523 [Puccinia graminis f. sp. tritici]
MARMMMTIVWSNSPGNIRSDAGIASVQDALSFRELSSRLCSSRVHSTFCAQRIGSQLV